MDSRSSTSARRLRSGHVLWAVTAALLLAASPRAGDFQTVLNGEVVFVAGINGTVNENLAALGVVVGAPATFTIHIDSTTPAEIEPGSCAECTYYLDAITLCEISIGSYTAMQQVDPGQESLVQIQIGNDLPPEAPGASVSDSYLLSTPASDTDDILGVGGIFNSTISAAFFDFNPPDASSDEGVVQDFTAYQLANASVGGANGTVTLTLNTGGGMGGGPSVAALCRKSQMLAAGGLGKKALACVAKRTQQPPEKDPEGEKQQACIQKASDKFEIQFAKAVAKAIKKGGSCFFTGLTEDGVGASLLDDVEALTDPVLADGDPDDKHDRVVRAKIIRAMAAQWTKDAKAYAQDAAKPNPSKLALKLGKSRDQLEAKVAKAIEQAVKKEVAYTGPDGPTIADAVRSSVEAYLVLAGGAPLPSD